MNTPRIPVLLPCWQMSVAERLFRLRLPVLRPARFRRYLRDDCVVDDASLLIRVHTECSCGILQSSDVTHGKGLEEGNGVLALRVGVHAGVLGF